MSFGRRFWDGLIAELYWRSSLPEALRHAWKYARKQPEPDANETDDDESDWNGATEALDDDEAERLAIWNHVLGE